MQPLVSVLMTAFNREKFIAEAIESVLASTYTNFELIIVDDCSKDSTVEIARRYEAKDVRVKVYVNEENLGDYPNRNKAASYANGKYLKYVDADDGIYYYGLQVVVEMMERFPEAGYGLNGISQDDSRMFPYILSPKQAYEANYISKIGLFAMAPTSLTIRKEVFEKENGFKPLVCTGDFEMWHRLSVKYPVVILPQGLAWSRSHTDGESGKWIQRKHIIYHYQLIMRDYLSYPKCPLDRFNRQRIIRSVIKSQIKLVIKAFLTFDRESLKRIRILDTISVGRLIKLYLILV